jgi:SAM-dependent methyltransferase
VCGGTSFSFQQILWPGLIQEWQLGPDETHYIDRQQGEHCQSCGANMRSIALADALRDVFRTADTLSTFVTSPTATAISVLELNEAGTLSPLLSRMPKHVFGAYPQVDMHALPYGDELFDVVVHSDTLEHVPNPVHALTECRRVLKPGGALCFTVPVLVGRMTRGREGLAKSYHGNPSESGDDLVVHTEFGADAWTFPARAGFSRVRLFIVDFPVALAMAAIR